MGRQALKMKYKIWLTEFTQQATGLGSDGRPTPNNLCEVSQDPKQVLTSVGTSKRFASGSNALVPVSIAMQDNL